MGRRTRKKWMHQTAVVTPSAMGWDGRFQAQLQGERVHVLGGVPDVACTVRVTNISKKKLQATRLDFKEPSLEVRPARCRHFLQCGGCRLQHLPEPRQHALKVELLTRELEQAGVSPETLHPTVASPDSFGYRMKMELTFEELREGKALGMHQQGSFHHILPLQECHLMPAVSQRVLDFVRDWYAQTEVSGYNPFRHTGIMRHLVLRSSLHEDAVLVGLSTSEWHPQIQALGRGLFELEGVKGVQWLHSPQKADAVSYADMTLLYGEDSIVEALGDLQFKISLPSFFQVNPKAAQELYEVIGRELQASRRPMRKLLDLYCGTGSIGIYLASQFESIYGLEEVQEAIADARSNAKANGIDNAHFEAVRVEHAGQEKILAYQPDALVVDPPRSGCHPKARKMMAALKVPVVVFVSCNPKLLSESLEDFLQAGYEVRSVTPVDMFPQTPHLEAVLRLELKG